eukprot:Phypoly_transcript_01929.p1 GENE.Phypoly_transcript_01929~~Phypoly_transcript_01929.p1  ORF type:complete len:592 (+),score=74.28 Phypoly_transcript_01929:633-2408(+)
MLAAFPLNIGFNDSISRTDPWWMGEKYDGVRCCWNAKRDSLYTRYGNVISLPKSISTYFPCIFLDAEIWFGRERFKESQQVVSHEMDIPDWSFLRILAFDKPDFLTQNLKFERRYTIVLSCVPCEHPFVTVASRVLCTSKYQLAHNLEEVLQNQGEGLVLRKPGSAYVAGRSYFLLKLKACRADKEALVVEISSNFVTLKLPDGATFEVPDAESIPLLKIGDVVTFTYEYYSQKSLPTAPKILRKRKDLAWDDVVMEERKVNPSISFAHGPSRNALAHAVMPAGHWATNTAKKVRSFFVSFARQNNFDPLTASNWYNIKRRAFFPMKGARSFIRFYQFSFVKALLSVFPEIGLEESKFHAQPRKFWQSMNARRQVLNEFAQQQGFDPLVAQNWYSISRDFMKSDEVSQIHKKIRTIFSLYKGSFIKALMNIYPEVRFNPVHFPVVPTGFWDIKKNQRDFFEFFASTRNFDPLVPENWYPLNTERITSIKGGKAVLSKYSGSLIDALKDLFPELPWKESKFQNSKKNTYKDPLARRDFLLEFAKENKFDPLVPKNWLTLPPWKTKNKAFTALLQYHKGQLHKALQDLNLWQR